MTQPRPAFKDDEIVVATEHLKQVKDLLDDAIVGDPPPEDDPQLGLTLIRLKSPATSAQMLKGKAAQYGGDEDKPGEPPLDKVLRRLKLICESCYRGWSPDLGKNRTMTGVEFKPYPNAGGYEEPTPAASPERAESRERSRGRVKVGLLDTRLLEHPVLAGRFVADDDVLLPPASSDSEQPPWWWEGHAAYIGGVVLAHAPNVDLDVRTPLRRRRSDPDKWEMTVWELAQHIAGYRDSGVQVLNLSIGCETGDGKAPLVLERAIAQVTPHIVVVAAAGNHGEDLGKVVGMGKRTDEQVRAEEGLPPRDAATWPAALPGVVAVGALTEDKAGPAGFNPRVGPNERNVRNERDDGDERKLAPWIDLLAPGVNLQGPYFGEPDKPVSVRVRRLGETVDEIKDFRGGALWTGTSFAAAFVTGEIAALMLRENMTSRQALDALLDGRHPDIRRP